MTDPTTLDSSRRLIERQYGRPLQQLTYDTIPQPGQDHDPVLSAAVNLYGGLRETSARLTEARQRVRQLLDEGHDSTVDGTTRLLNVAQDIHALTTRHVTEARALGDLLGANQPPPPLPCAASTGICAADDLDELLPLARRIAASSPHLTRATLGPALRAHGIRVSNQRLGALLNRLRTETFLGAAA
ncbi:hypothetical protein [Streptomyces tailanensis]|uniref:hypothetical protein n=1 Tax=Streptomyces tailanensis TaxID=2569858 RepID=UPI00122E216E|nr:hypothetical protein [Streptomyces tailanensis]